MSHVVEAKIPEIKDLKALEKAVTALGGTFNKNKKVMTYYNGMTQKCDGVISFPDTTYEVGLKEKTVKGKKQYGVILDTYCRKLAARVGRDGGKLSQAYQTEYHVAQGKKNGFQVGRKIKDGVVQLTFTKN
jgi:hypothetical protein